MKTALTSSKFWLALGASLIFGLGVSVRAADQPTLQIVSPTVDQQMAGQQVETELAITNFELVDYQTKTRRAAGQGHVHLWLDQPNPTKASAIKTVGSSYVFENVALGNHTLVAELVNNDHSSLNPPVVAQVNFVTVPVPTVATLYKSSLFTVSLLAFILLVLALYFVNLQIKATPGSGKQPRTSAHKSSKHRGRK